jgi:hypothetical protein
VVANAAAAAQASPRHGTKNKPTSTVGRPASVNKAHAMFKLTIKAVKVEINLWSLAALLQVVFSWIFS